MWITLFMSILSSEFTKQLIAIGVKKLLEHKSDGITKDVAEVMLDGIAQSRSNNLDSSMVSVLKRAL